MYSWYFYSVCTGIESIRFITCTIRGISLPSLAPLIRQKIGGSVERMSASTDQSCSYPSVCLLTGHLYALRQLSTRRLPFTISSGIRAGSVSPPLGFRAMMRNGRRVGLERQLSCTISTGLAGARDPRDSLRCAPLAFPWFRVDGSHSWLSLLRITFRLDLNLGIFKVPRLWPCASGITSTGVAGFKREGRQHIFNGDFTVNKLPVIVKRLWNF